MKMKPVQKEKKSRKQQKFEEDQKLLEDFFGCKNTDNVIEFTIEMTSSDELFEEIKTKNCLPILKDGIFDHLESFLSFKIFHKHLKFRFFNPPDSEYSSQEMEYIIRQNVKLRIAGLERNIRRQRRFGPFLLGFGILILGLALFLTDFWVYTSTLEIVAWVLIWQASEVYLFDTPKEKLLCKRYKKFLDSNIEIL